MQEIDAQTAGQQEAVIAAEHIEELKRLNDTLQESIVQLKDAKAGVDDAREVCENIYKRLWGILDGIQARPAACREPPALKLISTRKSSSNWQSSPTASSKSKNNCSTGIWESRKNSGAPTSPSNAAISNPATASGSQKKPSTLCYGSSYCRSATPSSR